MTSTNLYFTTSYEQPVDYHFSHDSVFLARRAFELIEKMKLPSENVLDLCAGCGVVGIDYFIHLEKNKRQLPHRIDFLEIQPVYQKHFAKNITQIPGLNSFKFLNLNYEKVFAQPQLKGVYDLILCNPPYFNQGQGPLSKSEFKNRCRFFIDSDLNQLLLATKYMLAKNGIALMLLKDSKANGLRLEKTLQKYNELFQITKLEKIRSTDFYQFQSL